MKITIELEEIKLDRSQVFNSSSYKGDGVYLVNDGIAFILVSVINEGVTTIHLPSKDIIDQLKKEDTSIAMRNYHEEVSRILERIDNRLVDMQINQPEVNSSSINADTLLGAIAIAQKPELYKRIHDATKRLSSR